MKERAAILFLCAGLLFCCAVGISMLFGCAGVALLVLGYLVQRDLPELEPGEAEGREGHPPSFAAARHIRIIARPSVLVYEFFDQDEAGD